FSDEPDLIHVFEGATLDEEQRLAGRVAGELMKRRNPPDSLFLFGEGTISGAYKSLHEMGVGVPGDVGLIGCAQRTYAEHFPLPLTCAVYPNKIMAEKAVRLLWSLIQGETPARAKIMVPSELMAGETCGEKKQKQQKKGKDSKGHE
ncbi:MAG: substrate-binding domain-containing protein, partial [Kiritimatiellae bacterium]|nr:substrate-binding domain-containing protein [Kiritimatiellia bacterium]